MRRYSLLLISIIASVAADAQDKSNIKFGKIIAADFIINSPVVDSNANAVVIADIGSSEFEGNNTGWFTLVYKRIRRIKIINQNGLDAGNVSILLFKDNGYYQDTKDKEVLLDLKGSTYNLENGKIAETKLDTKSVFENRIDKNWLEKKFTMPAIKAGSVIEYSYTIKSDFIFNLQPWYFQGKYPCLWSEYKVKIPDCFTYIALSKGYNPFFINEKSREAKVYRIEDLAWKKGSYGSITPDVYSVNADVLVNRWVIKDVPALKEESMVSTNRNYVSEIEFQLSQYRFTDPPENKMQDWLTVSKEFLESYDFARQFDDSKWLVNELNTFLDSTMNNAAKARTIFAFVRDNFTCTGNNGIYLSLDATLRNIYKNKKGSVSDINLLLTAMLKQAGVRADPVILSTRDHGVVHPVYPLLSRYNYVICRTILNDSSFYLDASNRYLGFNKLSKECFNGLARVISTDTATLKFTPDSLKEFSVKTIFLANSQSGNSISGTFLSTLGDDASMNLRQQLSKQKREDYFKELEKAYGSDIKIDNCNIDSLNNYDAPIAIRYNITYNYNNDDVIYLNPMFGQELKENSFKSEEARLFPIEMPYCPDDLLLVNMEIPKGYRIEEIPKSARIKLGNDAGMFEYLLDQSGNRIQLKCRLKINKAIYDADNYSALRDFYSYVLKKESEQIVLKKISQ
ncbi:DUF3857 domain-containing protein [Panacibacter ginsenosidivorans]|uniref:DUF3857 domain-containing protein n=1 Tax=Panacibacter ginsenosidivorans TaxID=1813871 RepID=A0A5B8V646_9BACT|nr:DUF3858 domain-containing protein [Panacibacter ginsenosidivorans]QEC66900.1 DUF3857 domain-containing protein [Panacibacter ginsenosidivorans]